MRNFNENTKKNVNCEHMKGDAIRYLNKIALNIGDTNITLYEHLEEEYINFRKITGELTDKLAEIGVSLFKYLIASPFICSQFTFFFVFSLKFRIYIIQNIIFNSFLLLKSLFVYFNNKNTRIFYFE